MKVEEVMTTDVVSVVPEAPLKEVAAIMLERGISGLPVIDSAGRVVGIVSETDILYKEREDYAENEGGLIRQLFHRGSGDLEAKLAARTAGEAMSAPAIMIRPKASVAQAATLIVDRGVNRLPVVEDGQLVGDIEDGELVGIVSRADLVRAFARGDDEIEREIREQVLARLPWPERLEVKVASGEVTLRGEVDTALDAESLPVSIRRVPGVVSVDASLSYMDLDGERKVLASQV